MCAAHLLRKVTGHEMRSLDLFSGLGGITYALDGYFEPALYCDIDKASQNVIAHHCDTGLLPRADLIGDVRSIHKVAGDVQAIVGGSPCQSISAMGHMQGIAEGTKSGLFLEIVRIVDENPQINVLFLENVSNILRVGAKEVVHELASRNFSMAWVLRHARGHGAPHKRERWFCLAVRDGADVPELRNFARKAKALPGWVREEEPARVSVKPAFGNDPSYCASWARRGMLLGNSVVPVAVRGAFEELAELYSSWQGIADTIGRLGTPVDQWTQNKYPDEALVTRGRVIALPARPQGGLPADAFVPSITMDVDGSLMSMRSWPTPRSQNPRAGRLTSRSVGDLGSALVHCLESQIHVASAGLVITGAADSRMKDVCVPSPAYVDWLMGYPQGWSDATYPPNVERTVFPTDGSHVGAVDDEMDCEQGDEESEPQDGAVAVEDVRHIEDDDLAVADAHDDE